MEAFLEIVATGLVCGLTVLLCAAGLFLSCLALSGTWLVVAAAAVCALRSGGYGSWILVLVFALFAGLIEVLEFFASAWGVKRRGGSHLAGVAAVLGGIGGMLLGTFIPLPVVGSLIGMLIGSFGLTYLVEYRRLKKSSQASHIATGAVIARILIVFLKVGGSLGMSIVLIVSMILDFG